MEEILIADRYCAHFFTKYGDILYTSGNKEEFVLARKYYSYSLSLDQSNNNIRAFYGLCLACAAIANEHQKENTDHNLHLFNWSENNVLRIYDSENKEKGRYVAKFLHCIRPKKIKIIHTQHSSRRWCL